MHQISHLSKCNVTCSLAIFKTFQFYLPFSFIFLSVCIAADTEWLNIVCKLKPSFSYFLTYHVEILLLSRYRVLFVVCNRGEDFAYKNVYESNGAFWWTLFIWQSASLFSLLVQKYANGVYNCSDATRHSTMGGWVFWPIDKLLFLE